MPQGALAPAAAALAFLLTLSACSTDASGESQSSDTTGGEGVPFGATKEDYIAAFEDVEPITLNTQTPAPQGSATGMHMESYLEKVEEWSGGKITFEIGYANAIADPAEIDDALVDGRLDVGMPLPIYEPSDYPATNALIEAGLLNQGTAVVGALQSNAWANDVALNTPEIVDEWEHAGMVPLVPVFNSGANALLCSSTHTSLDDISGSTVSAGGTIQSQQVEALGGSPVSIAYTELFESLQRGVVSCTVATQTVALLGGYLPEAPHMTIDPAAAFADAPGGLAISQATWETLPIQAKQLFWDSVDVFIGENITEKIWPNTSEADIAIRDAGGSVSTFEADASQVLQETNEDVLADLRQHDAFESPNDFVDNAETASEQWTSKVIDLGYPEDVTYEGFADWWDPNDSDIDAYLDSVMEDIYQDHRPKKE